MRSSETFASRGSIYLLVTATQALSAIAVIPLLTRRLSASEIGLVAAAQLVTQLLAYVAALGLPAAITREYFEGSDGPTRSRKIVGLLLVSSPGVIALAHFSGSWWSGIFDGVGYGVLLKIAVGTGLARAMQFGVLAFHRAEQRVRWFGGVALMSSLGAQVTGLVAVMMFDSATAYLGGVALCQVVVVIVSVVHLRPEFRGLADRRFVTSMLAYSLPMVVHSVAGLVVTTGDRVVIERMLGLEAVGRYQIAYLVGSLGIVALLAVNNAWSPMVLGAAPGRQASVLAETGALMFRIAALIGGAIALGAPVAVRLLAPPSYRFDELARVGSVVALATLPMAVYLGGSLVAMIGRETRLLAISTMTGATANIAGNLVLIPHFGMTGAAVATTGAYVLWAVQLRLVAGRSLQVPWQADQLRLAALIALAGFTLGVVLPMGVGGLAVRCLFAAALGGRALHLVLAMSDRSEPAAEPARPRAVAG